MGKQTEKKQQTMSTTAKVNPLKNEMVFVRFVPQKTGYGELSKGHALYGGLADGAVVTLCIPIVPSTGAYKNILTNAEKDYLEEALGLDSNALSVYKKEDNYWDNYKVRLTKDGIHLNLANPEDFIKYKVLLANSEVVAKSVQERVDRPKATYRFEIVRESEETAMQNTQIDARYASYMKFGEIQKDKDTMRILCEILDVRPYEPTASAEFLKTRIDALIRQDAKKFLHAAEDPMLPTKVVIRRSVELGKIARRGDYYYLASDGSPLCGNNEQPTLSVAARYLNEPEHQEIKFFLEEEVEKNRI